MKYFLSASIALMALGGSAEAQSSSASTDAKDVIKFNGSILAGGRSELNGQVNGGGENNVVGAYTEPKIGFSYDGSQVGVAVQYKLEAWAGKGFGEARAESDFANNLRFMNAPNIVIDGRVNDQFNTNLFAEIEHVTTTGGQNDNEFNLYIEPALTYKVSDRWTTGIAYYLERVTAMDGGIAFGGSDSAADDNNAADSVRAVTSTTPIMGGSKSTMHTGKLLSSLKINERLSLGSYARAGRAFENNGGAGYFQYRLQNELKAKVTPKLGMKLRHRLTYFDFRNNADNMNENRLRVIADYAFTDTLSLYVENEARYRIMEESEDKYKNESKLGLLYTF